MYSKGKSVINPQKNNINEMEISNIPKKEFKVMVINMLTKLRKSMDKHSESSWHALALFRHLFHLT